MHVKSYLLLMYAVISAGAGVSQPSGKLTHSLLWEISGNGLIHPSYLFGTMHILCASDANLGNSLESCIKNCDEIYFEIKMDDMSAMMSSMKLMRMNDNKKLSDLLDKDQYAKIKNYFEQHVPLLPFSMLERFKPLLISGLLEESGLDCNATYGMEMLIMKEAHVRGKKISGLETAGYQAGLFDSIPYEKQAHDLLNYIDSADQYKKITLDLIKVYRSQDLEKIDELTREGDATTSHYLDLLVYDRNRKWVDSLGSMLPDKSLLIAVGAGHLPGDQGLINLLRIKGYAVQAIKN